MRVFAFILMIYSLIGYSQENKSNFNLESVHVWVGKERLHHGNQTANGYVNTVQNSSLIIHNDSNLFASSKVDWYKYFTYSCEIAIRKENSKWRYLIGVGGNKRLERRYTFQEKNSTIIDTVYSPVPTSYSYSQSQTNYGYQYDSLLLDSLSLRTLEYSSSTTNLFVNAEILRDFNINKYRISLGVGAAIGTSIKNKFTANYRKSFRYTQIKDEDYYNEAIWYAEIPEFNPQQGTIDPTKYTDYAKYYDDAKVNNTFIFKPYIPLRLEAKIADKGFFSTIGVMGSANAGLEFQMVKNGGVSSRFFWNYRFGVFYRIG